MNMTEYLKTVNIALDNSIPVISISGAGEGKTQISKQIAENRNSEYLVINAANRHPFHISGLPFKSDIDNEGNMKADFAQYPFMQKIYSAKDNELIVIIDDLLLATPLLQGALMNLIEERTIDGRKIPDCVKFLITTNDINQNAGSGTILTPVINRSILLKFPRDFKAWLDWGLKNGVDKRVLLYIHAFPNDLYTDNYPKGIKSFPSPRSWEKASHFVKNGLHSIEILSGLVGESIACNCSSFIDDLHTFGNIINKIKMDPMSVEIFTDINKIYGIIHLLSNHFEKSNIANIVKYFKRYNNNELLSILFTMGTNNFPDSKESKEYTDFIAQNI